MSVKKKPKMKCVKIWLPKQVNADIKRVARSHDMSKSAYIRDLVSIDCGW